MWIGSSYGLTRFDGYRFRSFNQYQDDLNGLSIKRIHDLGGGRLLLVYYDQFRYLDIFNKGDFSVTKLLLTAERGVQGRAAAYHVDGEGDLYLLSKTSRRLHLQRYRPGAERFEPVFELNRRQYSPKGEEERLRLLRASNGRFWIADSQSGIFELSGSGELFRLHFAKPLEAGDGNEAVRFRGASILEEDASGNVWLALYGRPGMRLLDKTTGEFAKCEKLPADAPYHKVWADQSGNLLFKTGEQRRYSEVENLYCLQADGEVLDFTHLKAYNTYILGVFAHDFLKAVYLGLGNGMRRVQLNYRNVESMLSQPMMEGQWGASIRGIAGDDSGDIYVVREEKKWNKIDRNSGRLDTIDLIEATTGKELDHCRGGGIELDERYVWSVGATEAHGYGILRMDRRSEQFRVFPCAYPLQDLHRSRRGFFWLACNGQEEEEGHLITFDPESGSFTPYLDKDGKNPLQAFDPVCIYESREGTLWVGARSGLVRVDPEARTTTYFAKDQTKRDGFSSNHILSIFEDEAGMLWIGTTQGINIFDPEKGRVTKVYDRSDGLASNRISGILPDSEGNYWVSTYSGLSFLHRERNVFNNFFMSDGLPFQEFNRRALFLDREGQIYLGGINGLIRFFPADLIDTADYDPPILTGLTFYSAKNSGEKRRLKRLAETTQIEVPTGVSTFEVRFALPHYGNPEKHRYRTRLEGYETQWNYLGNRPEARFSNLPAGAYTLHVMAFDENGNTAREDLQLQIKVKQPFYQAGYFKTGVFVLALFVLLLIYRNFSDRKHALKRARKLQELDDLKNRFYGNLAHEFRAPLTVILGLSKQAMVNPPSDRALNTIYRNGKRLLTLVNQILDLRKIEAKKLTPQWIQTDVMAEIRLLFDSFNSLAYSKGVTMYLQSQEKELYMDLDKDKLTKILSNLLSNAIKFTPREGNVFLRLRRINDALEIEVEDTGRGIPEAYLSDIFDPFYQIDDRSNRKFEGTGIGLALTKELVALLGGTIEVQSQLGVGSCFTVSLPITRTAPLLETLPYQIERDSVAGGRTGEHSREEAALPQLGIKQEKLLLVEDNLDVAQFIRSCLQNTYEVISAVNGREGLELALRDLPDLIITDVTMPEMDGYELCKQLKTDEKTNHIPLVMLTARTGEEDRLEGWRQGADAYLAKPFEEKELMLQLENLLNLRRKMRDRLAQEVLSNIAYRSYNNPESKNNPMNNKAVMDPFLQKVVQQIETNLSNQNFTVVELCQNMALSKSQLHRKLTAVIGFSAKKLIRKIRVKRAKELLESDDQTIADIAFQSGFNDPAYFSRIFNQETGMSPSEYRQRHCY